MKIVSKFPQNWPHLNFALLAGDNEIDEKKIPLAAHAKLAFYQSSGVITGYEPSSALVNAADQLARKSRVKPPVATLETVTAPVVTPSAQSEGHDNKRRDQR